MKISLLTAIATAVVASVARADGPVIPDQDSFYEAPDNLDSLSPGDIIRTREPPSALKGLSNVDKAIQILFRTNDANGKAQAAATTVIVPKNADDSKLLSYQNAEDSTWIGCAPSYTYQTDGADTTMQYALDQGYYVVSPDYEGPLSSFGEGWQAGHATLDSIRAVLNSNDLTGISKDAKTAMWGYSGGSLATGWAAELQPKYAPELKIVGAAVGGFVTNLTAVALKVNKSLATGFLPAAILGIASEHEDVNDVIEEELIDSKEDYFKTVLNQCVTADLVGFLFQDVFSYFKDGEEVLEDPVVEKVLDDLTMGQSAPSVPLYVYQGEQDEIVPVEAVDKTVSDYCALGATVSYHKDPTTSHLDTSSNAVTFAWAWLVEALNGQNKDKGCSTVTTTFSGTATIPPPIGATTTSPATTTAATSEDCEEPTTTPAPATTTDDCEEPTSTAPATTTDDCEEPTSTPTPATTDCEEPTSTPAPASTEATTSAPVETSAATTEDCEEPTTTAPPASTTEECEEPTSTAPVETSPTGDASTTEECEEPTSTPVESATTTEECEEPTSTPETTPAPATTAAATTTEECEEPTTVVETSPTTVPAVSTTEECEEPTSTPETTPAPTTTAAAATTEECEEPTTAVETSPTGGAATTTEECEEPTTTSPTESATATAPVGHGTTEECEEPTTAPETTAFETSPTGGAATTTEECEEPTATAPIETSPSGAAATTEECEEPTATVPIETSPAGGATNSGAASAPVGGSTPAETPTGAGESEGSTPTEGGEAPNTSVAAVASSPIESSPAESTSESVAQGSASPLSFSVAAMAAALVAFAL